jgi:hypothetical protein
MSRSRVSYGRVNTLTRHTLSLRQENIVRAVEAQRERGEIVHFPGETDENDPNGNALQQMTGRRPSIRVIFVCPDFRFRAVATALGYDKTAVL